MRRFIIILALVAIIALPLCMAQVTTPSVQPVSLGSPRVLWEELGTITGSQAYPGVSDRDYTTVATITDANSVTWDLDNWVRKAMLTFQTTADADATVVSIMGFADSKSVSTAGARTLDDNAIYLGTLTLTGGKQVAAHSNVYVDTIVSSEDGLCPMTVWDSGNDRRCVVELNTKGLKRLVFIATTLQGSSTLYIDGRAWQ
jgi:hypothetical protein